MLFLLLCHLSSRSSLKQKPLPLPSRCRALSLMRFAGSKSMLQKCPSDIPAEYAATIGVNPCTAYRLLRDFVTLREGDCIIQNGANSQVDERWLATCTVQQLVNLFCCFGAFDLLVKVLHLTSYRTTHRRDEVLYST